MQKKKSPLFIIGLKIGSCKHMIFLYDLIQTLISMLNAMMRLSIHLRRECSYPPISDAFHCKYQRLMLSDIGPLHLPDVTCELNTGAHIKHFSGG